jgi:hypothetical protein
MDKLYYSKSSYGRERHYFASVEDKTRWRDLTGRETVTSDEMISLTQMFDVYWVEVDPVTLLPLPD